MDSQDITKVYVSKPVVLDPQASVVTVDTERPAELELGPAGRAARRRRMVELADEFATRHDELLRELAR